MRLAVCILFGQSRIYIVLAHYFATNKSSFPLASALANSTALQCWCRVLSVVLRKSKTFNRGQGEQPVERRLGGVPPEFPLIGVFPIIGVGHPWLPRPSAGLLDPTYRCTCTCYHQRGPQALESTQGGEEPDRFRAPGGSSRL